MLQQLSDSEVKLLFDGNSPPETEASIPRRRVVQVLRMLRCAWDEVAQAEGKRLQDCYGSIGFVLIDILVGLQLTDAESAEVLGARGI